MIVYFADRKLNILGMASTNLRDGYIIKDDLKTEDVDTGVATFDVTIGFSPDTQYDLQRWCQAGNYLLRANDGEREFYTIIEETVDTGDMTVEVYCEDGGLDLINDIAPAWEDNTTARSMQEYVQKYLTGSGFEIGMDESASSGKRTLTWDSDQTTTERLLSIANSFGYEIYYSFDIDSLGAGLSHKYVNIVKSRGDQSEALRLRLGIEISRITSKQTIENLATALECTGATPEATAKNKNPKPITLSGYQYDDGYYYVSGTRVISRVGQQYYGRQNGTVLGADVVQTYHYETNNKTSLASQQQVLCSHAVAELKKIDHPEINYDIELHELDAEIGDRVNVIDDNGKTYVAARILKLERSVTQQSVSATLGDYLIKTAGISQQLEELASSFADLAANRTLYTWIIYGNYDESTGTYTDLSDDQGDRQYIGMANGRLTPDTDLSDPDIYQWSKVATGSGISIDILSTNGTLFRDSAIKTRLTARLSIGGEQLTEEEVENSNLGALKWYDSAETLLGTGQTIDLTYASTVARADITVKLEEE